MKLTDIDELFKMGMDESEKRSEHQLLDAKSRVWEAIQKPKQKSRHRWLLMSSIAAAISMFVIASILYLKLDSKQKELEVLLAEVKTQAPPYKENKVIESIDHKPDKTEEESVVPVPAPANKQNKTVMDTEIKEVKISPVKAEPLPIFESLKLDLITQLDPVFSLPEEINLEQVNIPQASTASANTPTPRKRKKLRLKIGNSTAPYDDNHNSLALNIKL